MLRAIILSTSVLVATAAAGQVPAPCDFDGTWAEYIELVSAEGADVAAKAPEAEAALAKDATTEAARRATGDGLAEGRLDLLRQAFVALGLGLVEEDGKDLVFHFNPEFLDLPALGRLSPRLVVHEPALFEPLAKSLDPLEESVRASRREELEGALGDLDDLELKVRWTRQSDDSEDELQRLSNAIFRASLSPDLAAIAEEAATELAAMNAALEEERRARGTTMQPGPADSTTASMGEICAPGSDTRERALDYSARVGPRLETARAALKEALEGRSFFRIADLLDGQPKLTAEGAWRRREDAAGPDEGSISLRFDVGAVSYSGFRRWAARSARARTDFEALTDYLESSPGALPKLALSVSYVDRSEFRLAVPGQPDPFRYAAGTQLSAKANASGNLNPTRTRRLELEATYDDVSDDPARQDRLVGKLSWVEKVGPGLASLVGGSELVVSLLYGSKPEFRGEVDEELSMLAGLKWSVGEPE